MLNYFAYGSNMQPKTIAAWCSDYRLIGIARLDNYRLAFTRRSIKTHSGVADVVPAPNLVVWGTLYEIADECLLELDGKEGYGAAYTRIIVTVTLSDDTVQEAIVYTVMEKEEKEIPPSHEYLNALIEGAKSCEVDTRYIEFLESLASEDPNNFRAGLLIEPTALRRESCGMPLVRVSESLRNDYPLNHLCIVQHKDKMCPARVAHDAVLPLSMCQVDQSIRHSLGVRGRSPFGTFIHLSSSQERVSSFAPIAPRVLLLQLHRPSILDSEKQICILNERNVKLLGLQEGSYVKIAVTAKDEKGRLQLRRISRRVFSGKATILRGGGEMQDYPRQDEFYLDLDGRLALGLDRDEIETPTLVSPDIRRLFASRILYYGITLFLGLLALFPIIQEVVTVQQLPEWVAILGSIFLALLVAMFLTWLDLREKIQY